MDILQCSPWEWKDSQEMITNRDTALGGISEIEPQDVSPIFGEPSNHRRASHCGFHYAGYVEE